MSVAKDLDLRTRDIRSETIEVRVSPNEKSAIAKAAADAGVTIADFMRESARERIVSRKPVRQRAR